MLRSIERTGIFCLVILLAVLSTGCWFVGLESSNSVSTFTSLPTPLPITPIPPAREPSGLEVISPKPGEFVPLIQYGNPFQDTPNAVCIRIDGGAFLSAGDDWKMEDILEHTTILVDGKSRERTGELYDGIVLTQLLDSDGKPIASVGGPYRWCVSAPLAAGVHQVDFSFEKSTGEVVAFSWTFTLVDGPVPTSTPLPTPAQVDQTGAFPNHIEAVYPLPGEMSIPVRDPAEWPKILKDRGMVDFSPSNATLQPVCILLRVPELRKTGTLPRDIDERLYLQVDEEIIPRFGRRFDSNSVSSYSETAVVISKGVTATSFCAEFVASPGEHIATLYVDPFDSEMLIYSWAFEIAP